jgi:tRNA G10  N-methylase Trm11
MITFEDARQGMAKLRDNSVNMIFTDPPYISECIGLYEDLAREAKRVLKPGGYCFAYCGAQFLPQIMQYMGTYLDWFWLFEIKHNHGWPRMFNKKSWLKNCYLGLALNAVNLSLLFIPDN